MANKTNPSNNHENKECAIENKLLVEKRTTSKIENRKDGGWGWVVVFSSFMAHVLTDGVTYSFGVLTTEFILHFDVSREAVGWMASILVGMTLSAGPIASILCNKFGFRSVTIGGAIISAIGFCVPYFYPALWVLYLSTSVFAGLGFGLVYLPSIVTVSIYFQKKRGLAIGLAVCGAGIGTFVFSPLIELLISAYGWRGAMLIIGGLLFNCVACGAVYRPFKSDEDNQSTYSSNSSVQELHYTNDIYLKEPRKSIVSYKYMNTSVSRGFESVINVSKVPTQNGASRYICSAPEIQKMHYTPHASHKKPLLKISHPHLLISSQISLQLEHPMRLSNQENDRHHENHSVHSENRNPSVFSTEEMKNCIHDVFDKKLLKNPVFLLFAFSNFFTSIGFNAPFLFAKDRAIQMGIDDNRASFLISSIGIGNTLGRVIYGYLATKKFVNRLQLYNASLVISGLVILLSSFALTYGWMIAYTLNFGMFTGTFVTLTSIVLVDLLGIENLNASFGMTMVAEGAAVFIGPPLAGWIYDVTLSFDCSFWVCGGFITISGLMLYFVYCFKDFRPKPKGDHSENH